MSLRMMKQQLIDKYMGAVDQGDQTITYPALRYSYHNMKISLMKSSTMVKAMRNLRDFFS